MMFRLIAEERNEIRRSDEVLQTCFIAIDRNNDPKTQKHILGSQYTVIGTSDGGGRPHTADRHETSTLLLRHWVR